MSAKKMHVVMLTGTKAVLGAATRHAAGAIPVGDLVGPALLVRIDEDDSIAVPADALTAKEVDYSAGVIRQPIGHVLDAAGAVVTPTSKVSAIGTPGLTIRVTVAAAPAADKLVEVVIDGGNQDSLKFVTKTTTSADTDVPISGVPPGAHVVLAAVEGYAPKFELKTFV